MKPELDERRMSTTRRITTRETTEEDALRWLAVCETNGLGRYANANPSTLAANARRVAEMADELAGVLLSSPKLIFDEPFLVVQLLYQHVTEVLVADRECVYCGAEASTLDHVVARAHGGIDHIANLVPVCRPCNASKAALDARGFYEYAQEKAASARTAIARAEASLARWERVTARLGGGDSEDDMT